MDWDSNGDISFGEFVYAFTKWVDIDGEETVEDLVRLSRFLSLSIYIYTSLSKTLVLFSEINKDMQHGTPPQKAGRTTLFVAHTTAAMRW